MCSREEKKNQKGEMVQYGQEGTLDDKREGMLLSGVTFQLKLDG